MASRGYLITMSASFSNNFDNKEDSPLINALSRHIGEYYEKPVVDKKPQPGDKDYHLDLDNFQ